MLHGRGSNGEDLIGLADVLAEQLPETVFHSPNAPLDAGGFAFMWYPLEPKEDREQRVREAASMIDGFIDELAGRYGLPSSKIALVGFSQGSIMSVHVAPRRAQALAGVVAFSGAMFSGESLADDLASKPPFVLIHGADDTVLGPQESVKAAARFNDVGVPVETHILPGLPHSIDSRGLEIATEFLRGVLA